MSTFSFIIFAEPYKFEAIDSFLNLSRAILDKGHKIRGVYLIGGGVYNMKKDISTDKYTRHLPKRLEQFCKEHNVEIAGCSTWIALTGIKQVDFIEGACQKGLGALSEWTTESDTLIVFGSGG